MRKQIAVLLCMCCVLSCPGMLKAADPTPPTLAQLATRVTELEKQNKALLERIAALEKAISNPSGGVGESTNVAATSPAPNEVSEYIALTNKIPKEFLYSAGDTTTISSAKTQKRTDWIQSNVVGKTVTITFTVSDVNLNGEITGQTQRTTVFGGTLGAVRVNAMPSDAAKPKAVSIKRAEKITIEGTVQTANGTSLLLGGCSIK